MFVCLHGRRDVILSLDTETLLKFTIFFALRSLRRIMFANGCLSSSSIAVEVVDYGLRGIDIKTGKRSLLYLGATFVEASAVPKFSRLLLLKSSFSRTKCRKHIGWMDQFLQTFKGPGLGGGISTQLSVTWQQRYPITRQYPTFLQFPLRHSLSFARSSLTMGESVFQFHQKNSQKLIATSPEQGHQPGLDRQC